MNRIKRAFKNPHLFLSFFKRKFRHFRRNIHRIWLIFINRKSSVIRTIQGSKMKLDLRDRGIQFDLAVNGIRESLTTAVFQKELKKLKKTTEESIVICDIGANAGYWTLMSIAVLRKRTHVIAIEPNPNTLERLKKNIALNNYEDYVSIYQCAVGEKKAMKEMYLMSHSNLHTLQPEAIKKEFYNDSITVPVRSLPDIVNKEGLALEAVDVIRMDVQGYEAKIFKGMEPIINKSSRLMFNLETHPLYMSEQENKYLVNTLKAAGFEIVSASKFNKKIDVTSIDELGVRAGEFILKNY